MASHTTSGTVLEKAALSATDKKRAGERKPAQEAARSPNQPPVSVFGGMIDSLGSFFSSLRLTVVLLGLGIILVFAGTLAQVDLGLFKAQNEFFRSFVVYWTPKGSAFSI